MKLEYAGLLVIPLVMILVIIIFSLVGCLKGVEYEPMRRPSLPPLTIPPQPPHLPIMFIDEDEE